MLQRIALFLGIFFFQTSFLRAGFVYEAPAKILPAKHPLLSDARDSEESWSDPSSEQENLDSPNSNPQEHILPGEPSQPRAQGDPEEKPREKEAVCDKRTGLSLFGQGTNKQQADKSDLIPFGAPCFSVLKTSIFEPKCVRCHNGSKSGPDLSSYSGVSRVVTPKIPIRSRIIQHLYTGHGELSVKEIQEITDWIQSGAPDN